MKETLLIKPIPVLDKKEREDIRKISQQYEKLIKPGPVKKIVDSVAEKTPEVIKNKVEEVKNTVSDKELIKQALKYVADGFNFVEENAAKATVSEKYIIKKINSTLENFEISTLDEICFAREYNITKQIQNYKLSDHIMALTEGAGCGAAGFLGLIPSMVLSTFLYYRAVQSVAMFYGYDVKNNPDELEIASSVFMCAISPGKDIANNELTATIGKFMIFTETTAVKQASKKTWAEMIERGGLSLLIAQIRALANAAAKTALEKAGQKGLEESLFKGILEQLGKYLTLKSTNQLMPIIGAVTGALFDTTQMNHIIKYAELFYRKRFIEEKEVRINEILNPEETDTVILDVPFKVE